MEFNAFNGAVIRNMNIDNETVTFDVDVLNRTANIKIQGVESITGSVEKLNECLISNIDIDVTDIYQNTFTKVTVTTSDDNTIILLGDMKGEILNMEDFEDLSFDEDSDYESEDEDECDCEDCCGHCGENEE